MSTQYDEITEAVRAHRAQGAVSPVALLVGPAFHELRPPANAKDPAPLVVGRLAGRPVAMPGGSTGDDASFAVRVAAALGAQMLVIAVVARGLNPRLNPGDLMVFADHINATGRNPLTALDDSRFGSCFLDLSEPYDPALQKAAETAATAQGLTAHRGVYLDTPGCLPGTDDDLRALRALGADAFGDGGIAEVIVGVQAGLKVLGLALLSRDGPSTQRAATRLLPLVDVVGTCIGMVEPCI